MKKLILLFYCFFLFSCTTQPHLEVPGERNVVRSNIYIEYLTIADSYKEQGKYDKAVKYYKLAMKKKSLYWNAYYKLGQSYAFQKDYNNAIKIYLKLLKRDRENLSIQMSLAYLYAMNGNLTSSEAIYQMLWDKNKDNADVLVNYINVLLAEENYMIATDRLDELKEKFPENSNIETFSKKIEEVLNAKEEASIEDSEEDILDGESTLDS